MKAFLKKVAIDLVNKYGTDLSRTALVFPNKRASLFLNTFLAETANAPMWSPSYITISELFRQHSDLMVADSIKQVCDLHKCFTQCTGIDETLDHFFGWGQLMLADFDDIDKNMADAKKVFANVANIHELDDLSYLTEEQAVAIRSFFSNFSTNNNTELKRRFLTLWNKFFDIYTCFNMRLEEQGLTYEGALYRKVVTDETATFSFDRYVFIGFNVLQKVEKALFTRLLHHGKAVFYWDFDRYYMPHNGQTDNEAGRYIASYMQDFPNELDNDDASVYDNFANKDKKIAFIASPTENAQARYVSQWLRGNNRINDGRRTAIVMCDEKLLKSVIHCLPNEVTKANITTGYPLAQSPLGSLIMALFTLQTSGYVPNSDRFRLKAVNSILSHPFALYISDSCSNLLKSLNNPPLYYVGRETLCVDEGTQLLFGTLDKDTSLTQSITRWIVKILQLIARNCGGKENADPLFQETLFRIYTMMNRLEGLMNSGDLCVDVITMQRLVAQLIHTTSIPFHGEPAEGLQIMGVLETRNIDFDHVLLLSCNDGNMPKDINDTSFIPYNIRKAYELTTIDNKVAIYAYYFHRLLQRASDITIMYNSSAGDTSTGEMSRFMQQMLVESGHHIEQKKLNSPLKTPFHRAKEIVKNEKVMEALLSRFDAERRTDKTNGEPLLTPTAINRYLRCPIQFYHNYVAGLRELEDAAEENMQLRLFGNIFHNAAETIYRQLIGLESMRVSQEAIESMLNSKVGIEMAVDKAFAEELFKTDSQASIRTAYNGLQLINREVVITYLRRLLDIDKRLAPFNIVGLEHDVATTLTISCSSHLTFVTRLGGRIDRIDSVSSNGIEHIRVIDYKTGRDPKGAMADVADVFDSSNLKKHNDYFLQAFIYSRIVADDKIINPKGLPVSPALLFIQNATGEEYDPTLKLGRQPVTDIAKMASDIDAMLKKKVNEMFNPDIPFTPTADTDRCSLCPYAGLCF